MIPEVASVLQRARMVREAMLQAYQAAESAHRLAKPEERWCARDVLVHVTTWEEWAAGRLNALADGNPLPQEDFSDFNKWNAAALARHAELDDQGALTYAQTTRAAFEAAAARITTASKDAMGLLRLPGDHDMEHIHQLKEALAHARGDANEAALEYLAYARSFLVTSLRLETRPAAAFHFRPTPDAWSVQDILHHLAIWDRVWADFFAALAADRPLPGTPHASGAIDEWNREQVAAARFRTLSETLHELGEARGAQEMALRALRPEHFADPRMAPLLKARREHDQHHTKQIFARFREWGKQ